MPPLYIGTLIVNQQTASGGSTISGTEFNMSTKKPANEPTEASATITASNQSTVSRTNVGPGGKLVAKADDRSAIDQTDVDGAATKAPKEVKGAKWWLEKVGVPVGVAVLAAVLAWYLGIKK